MSKSVSHMAVAPSRYHSRFAVSPIRLPDNFRAVVPVVAGVGNALMALPLVRQLRSRGGAGRVSVVARTDAMAEPFRRVAEVDEVAVASGAAAMVRALRAARADLLVVPFPSNRWQYAALARAGGAQLSLLHSYPVGKLRAMHFIGTRVPAERGIHDVEQNLRLLRAIGVEPDLRDAPRFILRDDDRAAAGALLGEVDDFVAVHPGSARTVLAKAKRWPAENYARLIDAIRDECGLEVVLLEGPDERGMADEIVARARSAALPPRVVRLSGNLGTAAAVLERASFYVGSDSGLAHLAAAVGTRPVTLFAPADPERVCPFGYRDFVVRPAKSCSPCLLYPWQATYPKVCCGRDGQPMCITEITIEQVMNTVRRAVRENSLSLRERVG